MHRHLFAACLLGLTLMATAASGKPTLVGPAGGAKSPCTSCMGECLSARAKCVPSCGAGLKSATEPQKRCVSTCFVKQSQCQLECKKKACRE